MNLPKVSIVIWFIAHGSRLAILLGLLVQHQACAPVANGAIALFRASSRADERVDESLRSRILRYRFVDIAPEFMGRQEGAAKIVLNLFDDVILTAIQERRELRAGDNFTWFGKVENLEDSHVTLVVENGAMAGSIRVGEVFYSVRRAPSSEAHVVYQINPAISPREDAPLRRQR